MDAFRDDEDDVLWRAYARNAYDESISDLGRRNLTGFRESLETGAYAAGGILSTAPYVAEWLPSMLLIIPPGIGLAAVTLRLGSLWPLVRYHFAQDVTGLLAASQSSLYVLSTLGLVALVGAMGLWLLWQDHRAFQAERLAAASDISDPKPA